MPLPTAPVLGVLADNLGKRKTVLPLRSRAATDWAAGLDIPRGGRCVIYTGLMYQLVPTLTSVERIASRFEENRMGTLAAIGRRINRFINVSPIVFPPDPVMQQTYNQYLRNIVNLLRSSNVDEFGYLYEDELYAGALVHDLGVDDVFEKHARGVFEMLEKHGVKRIVTVDPHTTDMLKNVYPRLFPDFDVEVKSYLEMLADRNPEALNRLEANVVIHDSCVYARYLDIVDQPRRLLEKAGATVREPNYSGKLTFCCGGPAESLFPGKAREIATKRIDQLADIGRKVVAMCPICLANLRGAAEGRDIAVEDISEYLAQAYVGSPRLAAVSQSQ